MLLAFAILGLLITVPFLVHNTRQEKKWCAKLDYTLLSLKMRIDDLENENRILRRRLTVVEGFLKKKG